jgi:hypothetical protein
MGGAAQSSLMAQSIQYKGTTNRGRLTTQFHGKKNVFEKLRVAQLVKEFLTRVRQVHAPL